MCYIDKDLGLGLGVREQAQIMSDSMANNLREAVDMEALKRKLGKSEVENLELITKYNSVVTELSNLKLLIAKIDPTAIREAITK